jgi:hypothetical protein
LQPVAAPVSRLALYHLAKGPGQVVAQHLVDTAIAAWDLPEIPRSHERPASFRYDSKQGKGCRVLYNVSVTVENDGLGLSIQLQAFDTFCWEGRRIVPVTEVEHR